MSQSGAEVNYTTDSLPKDATLVEDDVIRYQEVIEDLSQDLNEHRKYLNNRFD